MTEVSQTESNWVTRLSASKLVHTKALMPALHHHEPPLHNIPLGMSALHSTFSLTPNSIRPPANQHSQGTSVQKWQQGIPHPKENTNAIIVPPYYQWTGVMQSLKDFLKKKGRWLNRKQINRKLFKPRSENTYIIQCSKLSLILCMKSSNVDLCDCMCVFVYM